MKNLSFEDKKDIVIDTLERIRRINNLPHRYYVFVLVTNKCTIKDKEEYLYLKKKLKLNNIKFKESKTKKGLIILSINDNLKKTHLPFPLQDVIISYRRKIVDEY